MLDGLLGRGFSSKWSDFSSISLGFCKSLIKATRARIEVVRRRAEAKQRFLKGDLAKLLSNGLDINAYGRTEEFLAGSNLLLCYDFIEQTCEYIVKQLPIIEKQRECPEECREAVASLMFAAARFSDLPELRDLRNVFQQRYGNSLEAFVNQKFCEKLAVVPPARAKRLQVLHDITSEFSIKWDSKGFEQRMGSPSVLVQVGAQKADVKQKHELLDVKGRTQSSAERDIMRKDNSNNHTQEIKQAHKSPLKKGERSTQVGDFLFHGIQTSSGDEHSPIKRCDGLKQVKTENPSHRKMQNNIEAGNARTSKGGSNSMKGENYGPLTENKHSHPAVKIDAESMTVRLSNSSHRKDVGNGHIGYMRHNNGICNPGKGEDAFSRKSDEYASYFGENSGKNDEVFTIDGCLDHSKALGSIKRELEDESDRLKSCTKNALLPPYVKAKDVIGLPPPYTKPKEDKRRASRVSNHVGSDSEHLVNFSACNISDAPGQTCAEPDENVHKEQFIEPTKMKSYFQEKDFGHQDYKVSISKPRSSRRKHHKSSSGNDILGSGEDGDAKRRSNSRRRDHSRKGLQMIFDEEQHKHNEEEMLIDELLVHYCNKPSSYNGGKLKKKLQVRSSHQIAHAHDASKMASVTTRSVSLPRESVASPELKKAFNRSNTLQPDNQARHVHPKLPDYDDLAERFAAMKGK
ncbi:ankyrin repeat domain-containing protein 12-like [Dorcoceras hygrometricum]|uniref:Ankyrin repeat domain-containing protein 12-like n=1 Tax=Dorcoceras hygrometricum TaxID=472368 RepID=A0A2Z7D738_9LAMI|nr:ankyrin repeat domain-containing protein 12-like [Dorcoceras hygrometricum]